MTDEQIDALVLTVTGFDGEGTQEMNTSDLRRLVRAAITTTSHPNCTFEHPLVQIVYKILVDSEDVPPPEQHWEGWAARRIIDAILQSQSRDLR